MNLTPDDADRRAAAAQWNVRRDRGLSSTESVEFELWLASDARNAEALGRSAAAWSRLDRIPDDAGRRHLTAEVRRRTLRLRFLSVAGLAAAAVLAVAVFHAWRRPAPASAASPALVASGPRLVTLADGSRVRMNAGSELAEQFTTVERHVVLTRGEAHFTVVSNPDRPFVVTAGSLRVRAVGTAFNVTVQAARTEVLVTEGKVGLERTNAPPQPRSGSLQLGVNERAVAGAGTRAASDIAITAVPAAEVSRLLAWQESLLRLGGATLGEIAEEFSRRTGRAVLIPDADLAHVRIGGRFRADDVEGFIRLLGTTFEIDVDVEHSPGGALTLRRKSANSRSGN